MESATDRGIHGVKTNEITLIGLRFSEARHCRRCQRKHPTWKAFREAHVNLARGCYERAAEEKGLTDRTAPPSFLHRHSCLIREDFEAIHHHAHAPFDETMVDGAAERIAEGMVDWSLARSGRKPIERERQRVLASLAPGGANHKAYRDLVGKSLKDPDPYHLAYLTAKMGADKFADEAARQAVADASSVEWQQLGLTAR
jgi:hypothetical protein